MLFHPAKNESAYLKMAIYGLTGTGKTYTSILIAMGLWHYLKERLKVKPKPICFSDSETGSDFVFDRFKKELTETGFVVAKTRAFKDLVDMADEAEKNCSIWIIDSITHYWNEMIQSYMEKHDIKRITLNHWAPLKQTWRDFSDKYINNNIHIIMCGRSADIWEEVPDQEDILELKKRGTKMKAEGEMGHESNLLVEMELHRVGPRVADKWVHRAWVNKDKRDILNFKFFDEPKFENFLPHIEKLNIGGKHRALDLKRTSKDMFERGDAGYQRARMKKGLLDRVKIEIEGIYPGRDTKSIQDRRELSRKIFDTPSFEQVELLGVDKLSIGLTDIEEFKKEITVKKDKDIQPSVKPSAVEKDKKDKEEDK